MRRIFSTIVFLVLAGAAAAQKNPVIAKGRMIGDSVFDSALDDPAFKLCD